MRILNVIVTCNSDGLSTIDSFGIVDEQDSQTVIDQAEERFVEQVVHNSDIEDVESEEADNLRDDALLFIDEGAYEFHDDDGTCVFLTWTTIENVQI